MWIGNQVIDVVIMDWVVVRGDIPVVYCNTFNWVKTGDASSISQVYGDKNIVEQFNTWETNDSNKDRWQFTIMGVSAGS